MTTYFPNGRNRQQVYEIFGKACNMCGSEISDAARNGRQREMDIDHERDTGLVTGVLCYHCNQIKKHYQIYERLFIGLTKQEIAQRFIDYMKRTW